MIAEDNDIVRDGLISILGNEPDMIVIAVASNGRKAQEAIVAGKQPDILLTDYHMPGLNGLELSSFIDQHFKGIKVIILSLTDGRLLGARLQNSGVRGFVGKDEEVTVLTSVIREVNEGKIRLPGV